MLERWLMLAGSTSTEDHPEYVKPVWGGKVRSPEDEDEPPRLIDDEAATLYMFVEPEK